MISIDEIIQKWKEMDDQQRFKWLIENKSNIPAHTVNIDNDYIFLSFDDDDVHAILNFCEHSHYLLLELFLAFDINAEPV